MSIRLTLCGAILVLAVLGCLPAASWAEPAVPAHATGGAQLTLEEALARTLHNNPELAAAGEELRAVAAEAESAGRLSNPELAITLENVAGAGAYRNTDAAELTIEVSQPLELGGKRRLRREAAELRRQLAANGQSLARAEVVAATQLSFIVVLAAQERLILAREQAKLAETSLAAAEERIKAGKSPAIDRLRLQGEASLASLAAIQAERALMTARQALAANWGDAQPNFAQAVGDLTVLPAVPALDDLEATLEQTPDAVSRRIAAELLGNDLEQARARRLPDPSLTVGWRQLEESSEDAWLFGITFPLPLFNRGRPEVAAAGSRFTGARARELSARNQARSTLRTAWQALVDARAEAEVLAGQVLPAAEAGFSAAEFGYRAGKFGLIELLDAQRTLFEIRQRQLAAQTASHQAAIELQRLLGSMPAATSPPSTL